MRKAMTNPPNDRQLRLFLAIAKAKSLRVAADKLGLTQPALSKQIRALELSVSAPLFRRDGRGMELTTLGQQLFQTMSHSYELVDIGFEAAASAAGRRGGRVSMATVNTLAAYLIPQAVMELKQRHSDVLLSILNASSPDVVERVERGFADLGLVYDSAVDTDGFSIRPLHKETLAGYCREGPAAPTSLSLDQLQAEPLILPPKTYALRRAFDRALGATPHISVECNSVSLALDMVTCGLGIAIMPHHLSAAMIGARQLKRVQIFDGTLSRQVVAISRKTDRLSVAAQQALEAIEHCSRSIGAAT
jgi:LysR family transcriptional regulator, nitrogen assimilation regulatory protein